MDKKRINEFRNIASHGWGCNNDDLVDLLSEIDRLELKSFRFQKELEKWDKAAVAFKRSLDAIEEDPARFVILTEDADAVLERAMFAREIIQEFQ